MSTIRATFVQHGSSPVPNITLNASGQVIVASGIVSSGTFAAPSGSVSAPGLYFVGDSNTGIYSPAADTIAFTEGGVEALRIDSSGRVGIGTSLPDSSLTITKDAAVGINIRSTDANFSSLLFGCDTVSGFNFITSSTSGSGTLRPISFRMGASEAFRVDTSGRVGIGTSTPGSALDVAAGTVRAGNYALVDGGTTVAGYVGFATSNGPSFEFWGSGSAQSGSLIAKVGGTEAARFDSARRLLVGTSSASADEKLNVTYAPANRGIIVNTSSTFAGNSQLIEFRANGTVGGSITFTNNGTVTAYVGTSDYRLKQNVIGLSNAVTRLLELKPRNFNFIANPDTTVDGFIAHEVQAVVPEAVTGEKDAVDDDGNPIYQGIDQSKLVPLLTAALQEAIAKIETLEASNADLLARVSALESA